MEVSRLEQPEQGAEEGGGASEKKNIEKQKEMDDWKTYYMAMIV